MATNDNDQDTLDSGKNMRTDDAEDTIRDDTGATNMTDDDMPDATNGTRAL
jgi:hypothetical protein